MVIDLQNFLITGMNSVVQKIVEEKDTACHFGSSKLGHLIATPAFVSMIIEASVNAVEDRLPPGLVTVGRHMEFTHDKPTCLGMTIRVQSTLKKIDGNRMFFEIAASDNAGEIGYGTHERAVVDREILFERANNRLLNK